MLQRRITVFVGHFGSGKTEIALNTALDVAARGEPVTLADLDVVKPYFRTRAARGLLEGFGIDLVAPDAEHVFADLPILVPRIRGAIRDPGRRLILDVGGDDVGARVLGSLADVIPAAETDCWLVLNFRRPSTPDVGAAVTMAREIEAVGRLAVSGLVSNTHLMAETTAELAREGYLLAVETGERLGVPVVAVAASAELAPELRGDHLPCPVIALRRIVRPPFDQTREQRRIGPLFAVG